MCDEGMRISVAMMAGSVSSSHRATISLLNYFLSYKLPYLSLSKRW
jgi:hypothetical protein